jgi:mRNA interferase RelE/StbE
MAIEVRVQWTATAVESLKALPVKVRKGIVAKVGELGTGGGDPREAHKPLFGPLQGIYSIKFSRYRILYSVKEERRAGGEVCVFVYVRVLLAGIRKERDRKDIYAVAQKLVRMGVIRLE